MSIDQISLPKGVGPHAAKLLDAITGASTHEELNRAGGKAEGFVLGLEAAKAIKAKSPSRCMWLMTMRRVIGRVS